MSTRLAAMGADGRVGRRRRSPKALVRARDQKYRTPGLVGIARSISKSTCGLLTYRDNMEVA